MRALARSVCTATGGCVHPYLAGCQGCEHRILTHLVTVGTQAELDEYLAPRVDWKALYEGLWARYGELLADLTDDWNTILGGFAYLALRFEEVCAANRGLAMALARRQIPAGPDEVSCRAYKRKKPKRRCQEIPDTSVEICDSQGATVVEPTPPSASILGPSGDEIQGEDAFWVPPTPDCMGWGDLPEEPRTFLGGFHEPTAPAHREGE